MGIFFYIKDNENMIMYPYCKHFYIKGCHNRLWMIFIKHMISTFVTVDVAKHLHFMFITQYSPFYPLSKSKYIVK